MIIDKNIPIKNIFYMLTYAFKELKHNNYEYISGEKFDNIYDLFAEILSKGVAYLLKQGLHKEFVLKEDTITTLRYNPQIQISAESETKRSIFREKDKTKRSKKESAQHSKSRNKSFVMTSVSAL